MLQQVHEHVVSELSQSTRTDTIFVVTAIIFNLTMLGINSGAAASANYSNSDRSSNWIFAVFILMTILINIIAVAALFFGRRTSRRLLEGLVSMYKDNEVDKYYNPALLGDYGIRYILFTGIIILLAGTAILVPLIVFFI
jgi:hypothetical protein